MNDTANIGAEADRAERLWREDAEKVAREMAELPPDELPQAERMKWRGIAQELERRNRVALHQNRVVENEPTHIRERVAFVAGAIWADSQNDISSGIGPDALTIATIRYPQPEGDLT